VSVISKVGSDACDMDCGMKGFLADELVAGERTKPDDANATPRHTPIWLRPVRAARLGRAFRRRLSPRPIRP
jgi:hypothetical protein